MKNDRRTPVVLGEKDENGEYKVPHTVYGLISNVRFVFEKIIKYKRVLLPMFIIGAITQSVMKYLYSYIGKYLIDIIETQAKAPEKDFMPLLWLLLGIVVVEFIAVGGNAIVDNRRNFYSSYVRSYITTEKNDKLLSMNYQILEQPHILNLHQRAANALAGNWGGLEGMMNQMYALSSHIVTMIVTATTIIILDPRLLLILTAAMVVNYFSQRWSIRDNKKYFWDGASGDRRKLSYMERCTQDFDYAKDIRLFSLKPWLIKKQKDVFLDFEKKYNRGRLSWLRHSGIYSCTSLISSGAMYYLLITKVCHESVSIGNFSLYLGLCGAFSAALSEFYAGFGQLDFSSTMVDDLRTFMDLEVDKEEDCLELDVLGDTYNFEFKHVCFRYEGAKEDTLKDVCLSFPAGQKLAVVGLNGAGKTTFIKLLLRLYDVTSGEILVNGININRFRRRDYYRLFAPVFQDVELFAFPLAENVSMKEPELTDKELAYKCLVDAGMKDKLDSLEKGLDTEVLKIIHQDGVDFSGGEKQKLALARTLYKQSPVVVLDEPTAALDALAEYELYQNFDKMLTGKSAVYISHRLSSTRFCDEIAMFVEGRIVEYGTHSELLAKKGEYAEMFAVQAQYYEEGGARNEQ